MFTIDDIVSEIHCRIDGPISSQAIKHTLHKTVEIKDFYNEYEFKNIIKKFLSKYC